VGELPSILADSDATGVAANGAGEPAVEVIGHAESEPATATQRPAPRWSYARSRTPAHFLTVPSLGPVGRRRHPATLIALSLLTLGGYAIIWHRRINREMSEFDARIDVSPGASTLAVLLPWLAGFAATAAAVTLLLMRQFDRPVAGITTTMIVVLAAGILAVSDTMLLFPLSLVATVRTLERVRCIEERVGMERDLQLRPVRHLGVLAVPFLGLIAHVVIVQRRVNAVWATVAPKTSGRRG